MLSGLNAEAVELARNTELLERVQAFENRARADFVELAHDAYLAPIVFDRFCLSAISAQGTMVAIRFGQPPLQQSENLPAHPAHAALLSSIYDRDNRHPEWQTVDSLQQPDNSLHVYLDGRAPEHLVTDASGDSYERAMQEARRQAIEASAQENRVRLHLTNYAFTLMKPGYVREPMTDISQLLTMVGVAHGNGIGPEVLTQNLKRVTM